MKKILRIMGVTLLLMIGAVSFANAQYTPSIFVRPGDRVGVDLATLFEGACVPSEDWKGFTQTVQHLGVGEEISIGMVSMYVLDNVDVSQSGRYVFTRRNSKGVVVQRVVNIFVMERGLKLGIFSDESREKEKLITENLAIKSRNFVMA